MLWLWFGCQDADVPDAPVDSPEDSEPVEEDTGEVYEPPTFDGDGLPDPEETDHDDGRDDQPTLDTSDTGSDTAQEPPGPVPSLVVVDALVASQDGFLLIQLFPFESSCAEWLQVGVFEGVSFGVPEAIASWTFPGAPGFAYYAAGMAFGEPTGTFAVLSADPHYVELSWDLDVTGPGGGRFYNCGPLAAWIAP